MSHSIRKVNLGNSCLAEITIIDYTLGGETFTLAELSLTGSVLGVATLTFNQISGIPNPNLDVTLSGGVVKLMQKVTGDLIEQPTTVGLNFTFLALIHGA